MADTSTSTPPSGPARTGTAEPEVTGTAAPSATGGATPTRSRFSPGVLVGAGLGIALLIAAAVTGIVLNSSQRPAGNGTSAADATGPVLLVPVDAPKASSAACTKLATSLPAALPNAGSHLSRRPLASPAPPAAAAWGAGDHPVVLRCGVEQPPEFTATSEVLGVSGVQWFQVHGQDGATSWYTVDRGACVALTLPGGLGTGPIQEVSAVVSATMPAVSVHPSGG